MDKIKHLENKFSIARYELIKSCSDSELKFYLYLKLYAINKHEAFPTFSTLKKELGWHQSKITRTIKYMIKEGRLKVGKRPQKTLSGKQAVNIYDITWYDNVNNKGKVVPKGNKVVQNTTTLFEQGSPTYRTELRVKTNRNITTKENSFKFIKKEEKDEGNLRILHNLKRPILTKRI